MKITQETILYLAGLLPKELEFPDNWPVPEGAPGQWARVMSVDLDNRDSSNPRSRWNMERAIDSPGFSPQYRPDWALTATKAELDADPELAAWAALNLLSSYVMAATLWQRKLNPAPTPDPSDEPTPDPSDEPTP